MVLGHLDDGSSFPREMLATLAISLSSQHSPAPGQAHGNLQWPDSAGEKQGSAIPGDHISQNSERGQQQGERGLCTGREDQSQQTPLVLLTHPWKLTEQQGDISQESGP